MTLHQSYLCRLQQALIPLPADMIADIVNEVDWHFRAATEAGRDAYEAARGLGDPALLGAAYRAVTLGGDA